MVRSDGSVIWVERTSRAYFDEQGRMLRIVGMITDITDRKLAETALADVSRKLLEAQEQERTRIGRELHDDINQRLAMLAVELEQLQDNPSEVRSRVQELESRRQKSRTTCKPCPTSCTPQNWNISVPLGA